MLTYDDTNNDKYMYIYNDMYVYIYITEMKKTTECIQPAITPHRPCHLQGISTQIQWQSPRNFDLKWWFARGYYTTNPDNAWFSSLGNPKQIALEMCIVCLIPTKKMGNFINLGNLLQDFSFKGFGALFNGLTKKSPKCKVLGCRGSFHSFGPTKKKLETEWETSTK